MRTLLFTLSLTLVLSDLRAQGSYLESRESTYIYSMALILVFAFVASAFLYLVATIEGREKLKQLIRLRRQRYLVLLAVGALAGLAALFYVLLLEGQSESMFLLFLLWKLPFAIFIAEEAEELGRNKIMWGILGFIEYHGALFALGMAPKVFRLSTENEQRIEDINATTKEKVETIEQLFTSQILTGAERSKKIRLLKNEYWGEVGKVLQEITDLKRRDEMAERCAQLEKAYSEGLFSKEEFERKMKKIEKIIQAKGTK